MGHAYLLLVPKSIMLDFYVYNKHAFRNGFFFTASAMIIAFQIIRYSELGRVLIIKILHLFNQLH